jgi:ATP-dependent DNA helicase RecG
LAKLGLNDRQLRAVEYVKEKGKITNKEYQELNSIIDRTALRDLETLITLGILRRIGEKKGTYYELVI